MVVHRFFENKDIIKTGVLSVLLSLGLISSITPGYSETSKPVERTKQIRMYALWQQKAGGEFIRAEDGKAIGGDVLLRVVISPDKGKVSSASVSKITVEEEANRIHSTKPVALHTEFTNTKPDTKWNDPEGSIVLQSSVIDTSGFHNTPHTVKAKVTYTSDSVESAADVETTISLENMVLTDMTEPKYIVSLDKYSSSGSVPFACSLTHAQSGTCNLKYEIFTSENNITPVVVKTFNNVKYPGEHKWTWDGKPMKLSEDDSGLFTCRITAESTNNFNDTDCNRSPYLQVARRMNPDGTPDLELEFINYDVSDLNEDDPYMVGHINAFVLKDSLNKNAKSGEQWFYDDNGTRVESWDMATLKCLTSSNPFAASKAGVTHRLEIWVDSDKECEGTNSYITHVVDNHADLYKDHKPKPALELN